MLIKLLNNNLLQGSFFFKKIHFALFCFFFSTIGITSNDIPDWSFKRPVSLLEKKFNTKDFKFGKEYKWVIDDIQKSNYIILNFNTIKYPYQLEVKIKGEVKKWDQGKKKVVTTLKDLNIYTYNVIKKACVINKYPSTTLPLYFSSKYPSVCIRSTGSKISLHFSYKNKSFNKQNIEIDLASYQTSNFPIQ